MYNKDTFDLVKVTYVRKELGSHGKDPRPPFFSVQEGEVGGLGGGGKGDSYEESMKLQCFSS